MTFVDKINLLILTHYRYLKNLLIPIKIRNPSPKTLDNIFDKRNNLTSSTRNSKETTRYSRKSTKALPHTISSEVHSVRNGRSKVEKVWLTVFCSFFLSVVTPFS